MGKNLFVPTDYEELITYEKPEVGLCCIVCIHSTVCGPALGGTRFYPYATLEDAQNDVIRLAYGMTIKTAMIWPDHHFGGGKAVIVGDPKKLKTKKLLMAYGEFIDLLNSSGVRFITAEDMNIKVEDVDSMGTKFVLGKSKARGGSGNPANMTALGVLQGMRAALQLTFGTRKFDDKTLVLQGAGEVGFRLGRLAKENNIKRIVACDINEDMRRRAEIELDAEIVDTEAIYDVPGDVFAPCAVGGTINEETIPRLQCPIVCGAANNQLADPERDGRMLLERGITYAPDSLVNAGGLINVANEGKIGGYRETIAQAETMKIYDRTFEILTLAKDHKLPPHVILEDMCRKRIRYARKANNVLASYTQPSH